jgi:flagellar biosynthesis protein FliP
MRRVSEVVFQPCICGAADALLPVRVEPGGRIRTCQWLFIVVMLLSLSPAAHAQAPPMMPKLPADMIGPAEPDDLVLALRIVIGLAVLSLAPALLMMVTSFTRIVIVLGFLRQALGVQQTPPNTVLVGMALFLTFFIMQPVWQAINTDAIAPYMAGEINYQAAMEAAGGPLRSFMLRQTREKDLALFVKMSATPRPDSPEQLPFYITMPAFVISELKSAFQLAFVIYIPFLVVDIVVASSLMSMGMFMLPPVMISLPFKILLFVMIDGWHLLVKSVILSFH